MIKITNNNYKKKAVKGVNGGDDGNISIEDANIGNINGDNGNINANIANIAAKTAITANNTTNISIFDANNGGGANIDGTNIFLSLYIIVFLIISFNTNIYVTLWIHYTHS